jgi:hypothetical protein
MVNSDFLNPIAKLLDLLYNGVYQLRKRIESGKQPKIEGELEYTRGFLRYIVCRPQVHNIFLTFVVNSPTYKRLCVVLHYTAELGLFLYIELEWARYVAYM